ncbi:reverse transcriptase domain-containing protein, partial [Tanacetum coccineum]
MSTRSSSSNLIPPFSDPESIIRNHQRNLGDLSLLLDFEEIRPPPADPPPQNHNGPPRLNLKMPAPDLQTMEELCKPTMNGRGGPIALEMATKFLSKYFPPSMGMKLRNEISNFRHLPNESLFEVWERYKLSIDRCPNHNMLLVTQIDTFYNGLTLRHRDTITVAVGGTFMKRRPEECYNLIENMTAHHNDWDTSAHRGESSTTSYSSKIAALAQQMVKIRKDMIQMFRLNQKVNFVTPSCETYG